MMLIRAGGDVRRALILFSLGWLGVWLLAFGGLQGGQHVVLADPTVGMRTLC